MQRLACQTCGAALHWDGQTPTVRCSFCGTEYLMHPREAQRAERASNVGRGQVDAFALTQGVGTGTSVAQSFIPKGWRVSTQAIDQSISLLVPVVLDVSYDRGDNTTRLRYQTVRLYAHLDNSPQNAAAQGQFQLSNGAITLAHRNTQAVCDEQALQLAQGLVGVQHLQLLNESHTAPAMVAKTAQSARETFTEQGKQNINLEWCHRHYLAQTHAGNRHLVVEALGLSYYEPPSQREIMAYQQLAPLLAQSQMRLMGLMGMGMGMGNVPQPPQPKLFWGTLLIGSLVASDNTVVEATEMLEKVRESFKTLPACDQIRRQLEDYLMQAMVQASNAEAQAFSQMTAAQNASWDRRSAIIRDANDHANSVMHSMMPDNAAVNDRMANLRSETIRGVNSYYTNPATRGYGSPNVVEADVRYDHVWQSHDHPDSFVAAEGDWLEPGVDFEELPRTNGAY